MLRPQIGRIGRWRVGFGGSDFGRARRVPGAGLRRGEVGDARRDDTTESPSAGRRPAGEVEIIEDVWLTELPENFPDDIPRYPGAEVVKARPASEEGLSVGFSTTDDPAKVAAYFADQFAAQGWATNRVDAPEGIMVFADKGDRSATYGVASAEGKTQIDLLVVKMR